MVRNPLAVVAGLVLVIVVGCGVWYFLSKDAAKIMPATVGPFEMFGTVLSLDQAGNKIQMRASSGQDKTVVVGYGTQIIKRLSISSGGETSYTTREINIKDLAVGDALIVTYRAESNGVLTDVVQIYAGEESQEDFEKRSLTQLLLSAGKIAAFDATTRALSYEVDSLLRKETSINTRQVAEDTKIYLVLDQSRASISHARIPAGEGDLQPGRILFITPDALIVSTPL